MPRTTLTEPEIESFRGRVCASAARLFAERGYEAVTLRAIAADVGCSPMTPYRYFADRADIFTVVRAQAFSRFSEALEAAAAGVDDPPERMRALGRAYVRFALAEPGAYRLMFELDQPETAASPTLDAEASRSWGHCRAAVAALIEAGLLAGDPDTVAHVFWAGLHGLVSLHLAHKLIMGRALEDLVDPMLASVFAGNRGSSGAAGGER